MKIQHCSSSAMTQFG